MFFALSLELTNVLDYKPVLNILSDLGYRKEMPSVGGGTFVFPSTLLVKEWHEDVGGDTLKNELGMIEMKIRKILYPEQKINRLFIFPCETFRGTVVSDEIRKN